jgi:hypothetical protein
LSGPYGLFDVIIDPATRLGLYGLNFSILGGTDANASDTIGTAVFSVTVEGSSPIPEPATLWLLMAGAIRVGLTAGLQRRASC